MAKGFTVANDMSDSTHKSTSFCSEYVFTVFPSLADSDFPIAWFQYVFGNLYKLTGMCGSELKYRFVGIT